MDTRGLALAQSRGSALDATAETDAFLPQVPAALRDIYCRARHSVGGGRVRTTILIGDPADTATAANQTPTVKRVNGLKPLPLLSLFDTTAGWAAATLLTWPKARVRILNTAYRAYHVALAKTSVTDIPTTFGGAISLGSSALTSYNTIAACTRSDIVPSSTFTGATNAATGTFYPTTLYSYVNCTAQQYNRTIVGLLDNSGGANSTKTIATIPSTPTIVGTNVPNAISSLAASINEILFLLAGRVAGSTTTLTTAFVPVPQVFDGTTTAISMYMNMLMTTDQANSTNYAAGQPMYVEGRIVIDWEYIDPIPMTASLANASFEGQG